MISALASEMLVCDAWAGKSERVSSTMNSAPGSSHASTREPRLLAPREVAHLVRSVQGGRLSDFSFLYKAFHRAVHAVLLARVRSEDARDLVQDVFTQAFQKVGSLEDPAAFPGWILAMARHRAVDHVRRTRRTEELTDQTEATMDPPPRTEAEHALRTLRLLPEAYRETLIMRLVEGMTGPEIAERTGMTPDSVRVNLHRGMKLLREGLGAPSKTPVETP